MRRTLFVAVAVVCTVWNAPSQAPSLSPRAMVDEYCVTCHNQQARTGGLALDTLNPGNVAGDAEIWEKVVRKLQAGLMPPPGMPHPPEAQRQAFVAYLEKTLDADAKAHPDPGRPLLHRLNRAEYANAIRDLLDLEIDAAALLPPDDAAYGFDNIADVLGVSPSLQERYLGAAAKISSLAVGDTHISPASTVYRIPQDLSQNRHIEGLPLGTVGGVAVTHFFPLDGEYEFSAKLLRTNLNIVRGLEYPSEVEFTVDHERIHLARFGGNEDLAALFEQPTDTGDAVDARLRVRVSIKAGQRKVTAAFLEGALLARGDRLQAFERSSADNFDWSGWPHLQTLTITGPFAATGPGDTPSRRRIFTCHPDEGDAAAQMQCAREILSTLATRAYREPVHKDDLNRVLAFYEKGASKGGFEEGIELGLRRILSSPKFTFRSEPDPPGAVPGSAYRISDLELASRLSFFLWSSIPDDELLKLAEERRLHEPAVLRAQTLRMLHDPKSRALVDNFAGQWLHLRNVRNIFPNSNEFPDFDDNLRQAFLTETNLFFESILREDHNVLDLLTADYTFVNDRLARHYGIPNIHGSRFRRVPVERDERRGLLGQGSILAVTSHAERTSPVVRGKWILENILGMPVPPPPPDVPPLRETKKGEKPRTMREQMAEHRVNAVCASCHKVMDPVGLALENFDAVGAWRDEDAGQPIDASGQLADGTKVNGVVDLRNAILARPELFVQTMTEKLFIYALGRGLDAHDMPAVREVVREAASRDYKMSSLLLGVVNSEPFQMRSAAPPAVAAQATER